MTNELVGSHFGLRWQAQRDTAFERVVTTERV